MSGEHGGSLVAVAIKYGTRQTKWQAGIVVLTGKASTEFFIFTVQAVLCAALEAPQHSTHREILPLPDMLFPQPLPLPSCGWKHGGHFLHPLREGKMQGEGREALQHPDKHDRALQHPSCACAGGIFQERPPPPPPPLCKLPETQLMKMHS